MKVERAKKSRNEDGIVAWDDPYNTAHDYDVRLKQSDFELKTPPPAFGDGHMRYAEQKDLSQFRAGLWPGWIKIGQGSGDMLWLYDLEYVNGVLKHVHYKSLLKLDVVICVAKPTEDQKIILDDEC